VRSLEQALALVAEDGEGLVAGQLLLQQLARLDHLRFAFSRSCFSVKSCVGVWVCARASALRCTHTYTGRLAARITCVLTPPHRPRSEVMGTMRCVMSAPATSASSAGGISEVILAMLSPRGRACRPGNRVPRVVRTPHKARREEGEEGREMEKASKTAQVSVWTRLPFRLHTRGAPPRPRLHYRLLTLCPGAY